MKMIKNKKIKKNKKRIYVRKNNIINNTSLKKYKNIQ